MTKDKDSELELKSQRMKDIQIKSNEGKNKTKMSNKISQTDKSIQDLTEKIKTLQNSIDDKDQLLADLEKACYSKIQEKDKCIEHLKTKVQELSALPQRSRIDQQLEDYKTMIDNITEENKDLLEK